MGQKLSSISIQPRSKTILEPVMTKDSIGDGRMMLLDDITLRDVQVFYNFYDDNIANGMTDTELCSRSSIYESISNTIRSNEFTSKMSRSHFDYLNYILSEKLTFLKNKIYTTDIKTIIYTPNQFDISIKSFIDYILHYEIINFNANSKGHLPSKILYEMFHTILNKLQSIVKNLYKTYHYCGNDFNFVGIVGSDHSRVYYQLSEKAFKFYNINSDIYYYSDKQNTNLSTQYNLEVEGKCTQATNKDIITEFIYTSDCIKNYILHESSTYDLQHKIMQVNKLINKFFIMIDTYINNFIDRDLFRIVLLSLPVDAINLENDEIFTNSDVEFPLVLSITYTINVDRSGEYYNFEIIYTGGIQFKTIHRIPFSENKKTKDILDSDFIKVMVPENFLTEEPNYYTKLLLFNCIIQNSKIVENIFALIYDELKKESRQIFCDMGMGDLTLFKLYMSKMFYSHAYKLTMEKIIPHQI